jgi:hypothetical protein
VQFEVGYQFLNPPEKVRVQARSVCNIDVPMPEPTGHELAKVAEILAAVGESYGMQC